MQIAVELSPLQRWLVMAAVGSGILLSTLDSNIVNIALPTLERVYQADFPTVQWVVLAYLLTLATLMLSIGRLADMVGKKPIYTLGFILFTIGSTLCALAPSIYWLIGFRVFQAVGGAMILALGMAIVTESFPAAQRGLALGVSGGLVSTGVVLGPLIGGLILGQGSWHWIFLVNLPVGVVGTLMVLKFVPDFRPKGAQQFDLPGALSLFVSLTCLLLALTWGQQVGFADRRILALLAGFLAGLIWFIWIELHTRHPMIELGMFRNRAFSISLLTGLATFMGIAGSVLLMPFYLENVLGYAPQQVGLMMSVTPLVLVIAAPVSGWLSDRMGTRPITLVGLLVLLVGYASLATLRIDTSIGGYLVRFLPVGLGMGIFQSPNNSTIMGAARRERLGVVSGMLSLNRAIGQTTGVALLGALWASRVGYYAGGLPTGGATEAEPLAQVAGMQDVFWGVVILILLALLLSVWALVQGRIETGSGSE